MLDAPVVLITGGNRGLGLEMAQAFAKKKYAVAINYFNSPAAAKTAKTKLKSFTPNVRAIKADVKNSKEVEAMIRMIQAEWGRIDVLINNAGITLDGHLGTMSDAQWKEVIDVNLNGAFYCTRSVLHLMQEAKQGSIINISSYLATKPTLGAANYSASKAGLIALTKSTALEMGRFNIRANAIMPGFHVTDLNREAWNRFEKHIRKQHLLKELHKKEELAEFVYSISQLTSVTGQVFSFESRFN